jgi:hypothetical protein
MNALDPEDLKQQFVRRRHKASRRCRVFGPVRVSSQIERLIWETWA